LLDSVALIKASAENFTFGINTGFSAEFPLNGRAEENNFIGRISNEKEINTPWFNLCFLPCSLTFERQLLQVGKAAQRTGSF
jgi:hypothetical protein